MTIGIPLWYKVRISNCYTENSQVKSKNHDDATGYSHRWLRAVGGDSSGSVASRRFSGADYFGVKVRNDTAGFGEFIEFYNPGVDPVSLNDYFIAYINTPAPAAISNSKAVIGDDIPAGQGLVLARTRAI